MKEYPCVCSSSLLTKEYVSEILIRNIVKNGFSHSLEFRIMESGNYSQKSTRDDKVRVKEQKERGAGCCANHHHTSSAVADRCRCNNASNWESESRDDAAFYTLVYSQSSPARSATRLLPFFALGSNGHRKKCHRFVACPHLLPEERLWHVESEIPPWASSCCSSPYCLSPCW